MILFLAKISRASVDVWASALSLCKIHDCFFHNSVRFSINCFTQSTHNFKVVFLIDRTTLWQEFMMHHAIEIKENSEQNFHIWPNLMCFSRSWFFWTLPLGWLCFDFNVIAFWANPDRLWTSTTFPELCPCDIVFAQKFSNSLPHVSCLKYP